VLAVIGEIAVIEVSLK